MQQGGRVTVPSRYGVLIEVMRDMHWSWDDLMSAPSDLVDEIVERSRAKNGTMAKKAEYDRMMNDG